MQICCILGQTVNQKPSCSTQRLAHITIGTSMTSCTRMQSDKIHISRVSICFGDTLVVCDNSSVITRGGSATTHVRPRVAYIGERPREIVTG